MENLEEQLNQEEDKTLQLFAEFKKYKEEEISFDEMFAILDKRRKEVLKEVSKGNKDSEDFLNLIELMSLELQEEEVRRKEMEKGKSGRAA